VSSEVEQFLLAAEDASWIARAREGLARDGRVQLADFLPAPAAQAFARQFEQLPWDMHYNKAGQVHRIPYAQLMEMDAPSRNAFIAGIFQGGEPPFINDNYHITDLYRTGAQREGVFADFHAALNSDRGLRALRQLVGDDRISYADAVAARYRPGHYLAPHTDLAAGEERLFAYVLNFAPQWRAYWGGQLLFLDEQGNVSAGYTPKFGALVIFKVPQPHTVSVVAPFAPPTRLAISGWFHASAPQHLRSNG
jgi:SM-20-related protein